MGSILVENLSVGASEEALRELFVRYGPVHRVTVVCDRDTGHPRGLAFVEMTDSAAADRAIAELNGATVRGCAIDVNEARLELVSRASRRWKAVLFRQRQEPRQL